jgi:hypothetical protein
MRLSLDSVILAISFGALVVLLMYFVHVVWRNVFVKKFPSKELVDMIDKLTDEQISELLKFVEELTEEQKKEEEKGSYD